LENHKDTKTQRFFITLCVLCVFVVFSLLVACKQDSRATLLVYSPHGKDLLEAFKKSFEASRPGVEVRYLDMGSQEVYDRVKLEKANPQADIWFGASTATFERAAAEDLLEPYRPSWADEAEAETRDGQDRWYGTYLTPAVIVYNKVAVKPEESPKDWDEVLDPRWRDRLLIRDPLRSDTMRTIFGAMILREWGKTNGPDGGYDWLRKLDSNTKEYTADGTQLVQKLARQEGLVSLWNLPDAAIAIYRKNLPLAFNMPASGTPVVVDAIGIIKGTRQPQLAREYYEFVTSKENLLVAARDFYHPPIRKDLDRSKLPDWLSGLEIKTMPLDQERLRARIDEWMLYWDSNIRNQNRK
jgi:iron(III) transport system substrate-binding protein